MSNGRAARIWCREEGRGRMRNLMSAQKLRSYVIVGLGSRSSMFSDAILSNFRSSAKLVGLCDTNQTRMDFHNRQFREKHGLKKPVPTFKADEFDRMIRTVKPDVVIVTCIDRMHHHYIIRAMELGCDVISEKPMTTDAEKCQAILDTIGKTGRDLRVTFNYRYAPSRSTVRKLIADGVIGEVTSVHFEWLLDTSHGADYFRRWHRDKKNSGGLMVHKATHHFDLVNWWIGSEPETVFAFGRLAFYGKINAEKRGITKFYPRATGHPNAQGDPFALDLNSHPTLKGLYLDAEHEDGYHRDQSVFGDGISIEDTMNVLVRYRSGAQMSYSLTAYSPWEGYRVSFNGTKGRIELEDREKSYVSGKNAVMGESLKAKNGILVFPHGADPYVVEPPPARGGHGGGDLPMLEDIFAPKKRKDPLGHAAGPRDGAWSILTGIAANRCFETGLPVRVADLVRF